MGSSFSCWVCLFCLCYKYVYGVCLQYQLYRAAWVSLLLSPSPFLKDSCCLSIFITSYNLLRAAWKRCLSLGLINLYSLLTLRPVGGSPTPTTWPWSTGNRDRKKSTSDWDRFRLEGKLHRSFWKQSYYTIV